MPYRDDPLADGASGETSTVGSVDGLRLLEARAEDDGFATEETGLLGAGAQTTAGDGPRKDSWIGSVDFEHLPPWKRPSVCPLSDDDILNAP
jgi:hypothetical protein